MANRGEFSVGSVVVLSDGKNSVLSRIDGIRRGHLRVECLLFDWCGNEVNVPHNTGFKIYPFEVVRKNNA